MLKKIKEIYNQIKNINLSVKEFQKDSVIQSLPTVALVNKAVKLIEKKEFDNAEQILKNALDISSQDNLVYKYLGKIYENRGNFLKASEYYEKSAQLNKNDKEIFLRLGMCYLYSNNIDKSISAFEKANKITPLNTEISTGWGMALMKQKKYALARDKFNQACSLNKYNFSAILLSAAMEVRLGEYSIAEEKLLFLTKVAPNESSFYEYANLKLIQAKYDQAQEYALKALEINKLMLPVYFILGEVYSVKRDLENFEKYFDMAEELNLDNEILYFERAKGYVRLLDFEKAGKYFEMSLEKNPQFTDAKIGLALLDSYNGNFVLADEFSQKYAQNVYIQEALGLKYLKEKNLENAKEMFKKALKTDRNQTYNYYNLAKVGIYEKDSYKVREYFDKFLALNPLYLPGFIDYSEWLINVSDFEEAQRKLRKAYKLSPSNVEVLNLLFLTQYTLVKNNVCEYNIKEALSIAQTASESGRFDYEPQKQELEDMLEGLREEK